MEAVIGDVIGLMFAAGMLWLGLYLKRTPETAYRWFTFRQRAALGERFAIGWARAAGWLFTVFGSLGVVMYLFLIPFDLLRSR
jgi:hypothetical protein